MHILHVIESLEFGGAEKVVVDLANGLAQRERVSICCLKMLGPLRATLDDAVEVFCLNKGEGNDYGLPLRLAREMTQRGVDAVHTHNWGTFVEGMLAARCARASVRVHTVHGSYAKLSPGLPAAFKRALRHFAERCVAHWCQRVIAVSDSIRLDVQREVGIAAQRICTIHNGIDLTAPARRIAAPTRLRFISVGRLAAVKNFPLMLTAFAQLGAADAELTIVGDGPERQTLETLAQTLGIGARVRFLGFRTDIAQLLTQADVFLISSEYEGISIAVLEAMRAGLPVIATCVGGIPETVIDGATGIVVAPGDTVAFADALRRVIAEPALRSRLGSAGSELAQKEFSLRAMIAQYEQLYRQLHVHRRPR